MAKISLDTLLTRAEEQFSLGKYQSALTTYGILLKEYPKNSDAQVGVFLCDIGLESGDEAQALFDYYKIIKNEQDNAGEIMINLLSTLDTSNNQLNKLLKSDKDKIEYKDGIEYKDFLRFIDARGDFKQAFEDVMFSTHIILRNKEEYMEFIEELIKRGQKELALQFLDSSSGNFHKNQEIYALYHKIKDD